MQNDSTPLCIDLDGLLAHPLSSRGNVTASAAVGAARSTAGGASITPSVAAPDVSGVSYDERVIAWLRAQDGRTRILCARTDRATAHAYASHLGVFDDVIAADDTQAFARFGTRGFDYVGGATPDEEAWTHARRVVLVDPPASLLRHAHETHEVEHVFARTRGGWRAWLRAARPHQWLKNLLVFVPMLAAHRAFDPAAIANATLAFVGFSLCASAAYVINDLFDLAADRAHPRKRLRPFASGALSVRAGMIVAPLLAAAGLALAYTVAPRLALVLAVYVVATLAYSLALKRVAMLDVVTLAALYTVRIVGGAVAIPVPASFWLLALSMFLFLSLAMLKRYTELRGAADRGQEHLPGRDYVVGDLSLIESLGTCSGFLSALVLALYIDSTASQALYRHHEYLWALTPALLYWVGRAWLIARRGDMHDDPVVFALTDRGSLLVAAIVAVVGAAAI